MGTGFVQWKKIGEKLGMKAEIRDYRRFNLTDEKKGRQKGYPTRVMSHTGKVSSLCYAGEMEKWTNSVLSFFAAVALFCVKEKDVTYNKTTKPHNTCIYTCINEGLDFPKVTEKRLKEQVFGKNFDFKEYLNACRQAEAVDCDIDSAITVYDLQGDEAIYHIICNVFTKLYTNSRFSCLLLPDCKIKWKPEISEYASGTTFPVIVSPFSKKTRWVERNNGFFLETYVNKQWYVIDCAQIDWFTLFNESTSARRHYWAAGGEVVPYLICHTWEEIVEAVGHFGRDVLVRDMRTNLTNGYWFKFGPKAKVNVRRKGRRIAAKGNSSASSEYYEIMKREKEGYYTVTLDMKERKKAPSELPLPFTGAELNDLFELGNMCVEKMQDSKNETQT